MAPKTGSHHLDRRAQELIEAGAGPDDELLSTRQLAGWLGVTEQFLETGRREGFGPPFRRLSHTRVRYFRSEVKDWLDQRRYTRNVGYPKRGKKAKQQQAEAQS